MARLLSPGHGMSVISIALGLLIGAVGWCFIDAAFATNRPGPRGRLLIVGGGWIFAFGMALSVIGLRGLL